MQVRFRRLELNPDLPLPSRGTAGAAACDVATPERDIELQPGERRLVHPGLEMELPHDVECQVRPRSGLALKHGIMLPNSPATIDPDYRGELRVIVWNSGSEPVPVPRGMRIAQLVFARFEVPEIVEADALSESERGTGGFGSTGH
jgi:dUTP pyrophosphatase